MHELIEKLAREAGGHFEASEEPASCADEWIFTPATLEAFAQAVARMCAELASAYALSCERQEHFYGQSAAEDIRDNILEAFGAKASTGEAGG